MKLNAYYLLLLVGSFIASCSELVEKDVNIHDHMYKEGSFGYDLDFLKKHDSVIVLQADEGQAQVIVSPKYQAKVFTSTAQGQEGLSFGWVNYKAFAGPEDTHMNAFGGENRLWLGPEGGPFSLFFKPGSKMTFENWKTPASFDTEKWQVAQTANDSVTLRKEMKLGNYQGTKLQLVVERTIRILTKQQITDQMGTVIDTTVNAVGYETMNVLTNTGSDEWTQSTGMPCIWILDMFKPSPATVIAIPFKAVAGESFNKVATTNYFGEIPADRLKHKDDILFFKADGKSRGKLGITPGSVKPVAGSYDADNKILTIIVFDIDPRGSYLNQEWNTTKPTFSGDAMNAYNDGPLTDGTQMGPFYELESVSPAAKLKPNQSLSHRHSVYHFTGEEPGLDRIANSLLGVALNDIKKAF